MIRFLQTPGKTKKIVLSAMLLVICVAMVWYLVPSSGGDFSTNRPGVLATVGGQEVNVSDIQKLSPNRELLGPEFNQAFNEVVGEKVLLMEADRIGLRVTDDELRDALHKGQYGQIFFHKGQSVGEEEYSNILRDRANTTVPEFEKNVKTQLLLGKLQKLVTAGAQVPLEEVQREFVKQNTKVKLQYAIINSDEIAKTINPNETELKAFYEQRKASYATALPEKRKARYIAIEISKLQNQVKVSPDELQSYYKEHVEEFRQPEQVKASHILIKVAKGADAKVDEAARAKAEDILKQLKSGAKFEELASKYSEDRGDAMHPGSAQQGGFLGWFGHGSMVAEFEQAAFSTPVGQISGIVKSEYGNHIIRVDDKHEARIQPLEEVRGKLEPQVAGLKAHQEADALAAAVTKEAQTHGLEAAAAKNHLNIVNQDWFSHSDSLTGMGKSSDFMDAAFSAKEKSPPSEVATDSGYVVFEITAVQPPAAPTYDDVRSQVAGDYKNEQTAMGLYKKTQELGDRAHVLKDLQRAAKELGAKPETTSDFVGPQDPVKGLGSMAGQAAVAFSLKPGEISSPIRAGSNGAGLTVIDRKEPTQAEIDKGSDQVRESLVNEKRQEMLVLYIDGLRQTMQKEGKVKANQKELDLYTN